MGPVTANLRKALTGPVILFLVTTGAFWKLLTKQYTWVDHPDMVYQVLPWFQFQAVSWHNGIFPLWDPHVWGGQPLVGQMQPGAAYPPNWLLFLLPLRDGHIQLAGLHGYFILTHFFAALTCFWLCRDLGRTVGASIFAGFAFALGGLVGSIEWPQMLNGAVWIPLCLLFYFRSVRGQARLASAAFAGTFLGIAFLSGHHQIPTFAALMMAGLWLVEFWRTRNQWPRTLQQAGVFVLFAALVSALQTLPAYEYGTHAIRFVGSQNGVFWGQYVPYIVHQQYSLAPADLTGLLLSAGHPYTFMGITVVTLALLGFWLGFGDRVVRLLGGTCIGAILLALGSSSVFHGIAYLLIPMVEKARSPAMAIVIAQLAFAVMASYGIDALRQRSPGRWPMAVLLTIGVLPWPALAIVSSIRPEAAHEYGQFAVAALAALAVAAVLHGWQIKQISEGAAVALLAITALFELGTVTGQSFRHRETPGGYLPVLERHADVIDFLKKQSDLVRLEVDTDALPYNIGDWDGIDQFRAYLGGMTSNLVPFEIERLKGGAVASNLFGLNYAVGTKPFRAGQTEVLHGASGLNVYRNPDALPRLWTAHRLRTMASHDLVSQLASADLKREVFLDAPLPALEDCGAPDSITLLGWENERIAMRAQMACKGLLVLNQTPYPGWQAFIDGSSAPIEEADGALQSVVVDAGTHRVEFRYRPWTVYWGGLLTAVGLGAALLLALFNKASAKRASGNSRAANLKCSSAAGTVSGRHART
jgi:hypothetical protein